MPHERIRRGCIGRRPCRTPTWSAAALLAALAWIGVAACSGIQVETDYNPAINFLSFQRYGWLTSTGSEAPEARPTDREADERVRSAVDGELTARGFQKSSLSEADFLVAYYVDLESKLDFQRAQRSYGYGYRGWGSSDSVSMGVTQYEEGTLLIDFVDPSGKELLWRGVGTARLGDSTSPQRRETRVKHAVREILNRFPPD